MPWRAAANTLSRRLAVALVLFGLVIAGVGGYLVHAAITTRDKDLNRIACDVISRQVGILGWEVGSGRIVAREAASAGVRSFYRTHLPGRVEALRKARGELRRRDCPGAPS